MNSNVATEVDDDRLHRVCRWSIEIAIGLFYAMLVAGVVSFFATAYIEISQKESESLFGKGWRFVSIHDWHLMLPSGVWMLIFPGGILVGLISGATRGRILPAAIAVSVHDKNCRFGSTAYFVLSGNGRQRPNYR